MDLVSILATVILVTTIGTMVIGVGAYYAFKLRDKRKPNKKKADDTMDSTGTKEPIFLKRYVPTPPPASSPEKT
jgi:heme/copper-type cytochrome/quinol oxidase subunit 2